MSLDPVHAPTDPLRPAAAPATHPVHASRPAAGAGSAGRPSQADHGLCRESRRSPHLAAQRRGHLAPAGAIPSESFPDGASAISGLALDEIEARLAAAPRDDISGLRWMMDLYQRLLDMLLNDPDAPEQASRRQWLRLRRLQRRLRSASQRPAAR